MRPSLFTMPARWLTPISVPMVSNISIKRKVNTTTNISSVKMFSHWNLQKIGSIEDGADITPLKSVIPIGIPIAIVANTPRSIAPGTFLIYRKPVISKPMMPSNAGPSVMLPSVTSVASLLMMISDFCKPMKAINSPIPAPMARRIFLGMELTIASRMLVIVININMIPSKNTAVNAKVQS